MVFIMDTVAPKSTSLATSLLAKTSTATKTATIKVLPNTVAAQTG